MMICDTIDEKPGSAFLHQRLKELSPFVYLPNVGNLGDLLIAEGARQLFARLGVEYTEYDADNLPERFNLVFAGGARLTAAWNEDGAYVDKLLDSRVMRGVVLPHSINGIDSSISRFDERFLLCCRDERSAEYCSAHNDKAEIVVAQDLAVELQLPSVALDRWKTENCLNLSGDALTTYRALRRGLFDGMQRSVKRASVWAEVEGRRCRVAFLLRRDKERATAYFAPHTYDISAAWHTEGGSMCFNEDLLSGLAAAMRCADVVVTDRLHAAIAAFHAGCEVYMIDNSYKKLSGVYRLSFANQARMHLAESGTLPPDLQRAWVAFDTPCRRFRANLNQRCSILVRKLRGAVRPLVRRLKGKSV